MERAEALLDLNRSPDAQLILRRVLATWPEHPYACCLLARALLDADPEQALGIALQAIRADPREEYGYRLASIALLRLGRPAEAVDLARQALTLAPQDWRTHVHLSTALSTHWPASPSAREAALTAVTLAPGEPRTHFTVGRAALRAGDRQTAEDAFRRALALDPQFTPAREQLAMLPVFSPSPVVAPGKLAGSARGLAEVLRTNPRAEDARENLGTAFRGAALRAVLLLMWLMVGVRQILQRGASPVQRLAILALLAVPVFWAGRYLRALTPALRRHLARRVLTTALGIPVALGLVTVVLIVVAVFSPPAVRTGILTVVPLAPFTGWLMIRFGAGAGAGAGWKGSPRSPALRRISTPVLTILAGALLALGLLVAGVAFAPDAAPADGPIAGVFLIAAAVPVGELVRRLR